MYDSISVQFYLCTYLPVCVLREIEMYFKELVVSHVVLSPKSPGQAGSLETQRSCSWNREAVC